MLATVCYESEFVSHPNRNGPEAAALSRGIMLAYYGATPGFLLLDLAVGVNVRVAFLAGDWPLRAAYYGICLVCLALILWRPAWAAVVGAFESLLTLAALITRFGTRAILASDAALAGREPPLSIDAVINFLLAGGIAYLAWTRGMAAFRESLR